MESSRGDGEVVKLAPFPETKNGAARRIRRNEFSAYRLVLFFHDLLLAYTVFFVSAWLTDVSPFQGPAKDFLSFLIFSFVFISFFSTFGLYSYHLIFLRRGHQLNILRAFAWSILTLGIIGLIHSSPNFLEDNSVTVIIWISLAAIELLLLSRLISDSLLNLLKAVGISFIVIGIVELIESRESSYTLAGWSAVGMSFFIAFGTVLVSRSLLVHFVFNDLLRRRFRRQGIVVGSDEEARRIIRHVVRYNAPFWVAGFVSPEDSDGITMSLNKNRLGDFKNLPQIVDQNRVDEIIVTDEDIDKTTLISLLDYCISERITVWFSPKLMPIIDLKLRLANFCGISMIKLGAQKNHYIFEKMKHALDALIVLPSVIVLLPGFLAIAAAIKLNSRGPVFYKAVSIGRHGRPFTMYKFRSMVSNTSPESHKNYVTRLIGGEIRDRSGTGGVFKMTDDHRITSVGRVLRKYSVDELPQLINVLKGEMSLVGPRPCLPYEYEAYRDWHKKRLAVRPGITGIWQVSGRSGVSFDDMVLLDLYYVYNRSLWMDMNILYETIFAVLEKRGAY
jgi:undecaprenyl-phosphate galactose phosphotransferase